MHLALIEAERGRGHTSPNPMVGCVIVKNDRVVASGYHRRAGKPHAEIDALKKLGGRAQGATAYVTLEPCNHIGRTGKCTDALLDAGIRRVVCGMRDPNPNVAGGGAARLRRAGIRVDVGVLEGKCRTLNEAFIKWATTGRPLVTLKAAISLDGRIATASGDSKWISNLQSRKKAHQLRAEHDAILVGAQTIIRDDPELTTRLARGKNAQRVILDGRLRVPSSARAISGALIVTCSSNTKKIHALQRRGAEVIQVRGDRRGRVNLPNLLDELGRRQITSLLVEGGGEVHGQFVASGLADKLVLFVSPRIIGSNGVALFSLAGAKEMEEAWQLKPVTAGALEGDVMWIGYFVEH